MNENLATDRRITQKNVIFCFVTLRYVGLTKKNKGIIGSIPSDDGTTSPQISVFVFLDLVQKVPSSGEGVRNSGDAVNELEDALPVEEARNGMGYYVQTGLLMPTSSHEVTLRYGQILPSQSDTSLQEQSEAGIGFNYYVGEHAYKIQSDIFQTWSEGSFVDGNTQARIQLQMAY